jgi:hypothetical protein
MALLNSSHVIAVMTPSTKGSQWVPYEYGRAKAPVAVSLQAGCWVDKSIRGTALPEYLHLGHIMNSEYEIRQWLKAQLAIYFGQPRYTSCSWSRAVPAPLP